MNFKLIGSLIFTILMVRVQVVSAGFSAKVEEYYCDGQNEERIKYVDDACRGMQRTCGVDNPYWRWEPRLTTTKDVNVLSYQCVRVDCRNGEEVFWQKQNIYMNCSPSDNLQATSRPRFERNCNQQGSIIQTENRAVGEIVPLTGADFGLSYFSNRVLGRKADYKIHSVLSTAAVNQGVVGYDLTIWVKTPSGPLEVLRKSFPAEPNQIHDFYWNGLDPNGRPLWGSQNYEVEMKEVRSLFTLPNKKQMTLGNFQAKFIGLGGWMPTVLHYYDLVGQTTYLGTGVTRKAAATKLANGTYRLAAEDASEVYIFDSKGKHLETRSGLTGVVVAKFAYDSQGRITSIIQTFDRVTTFNRDASGNLKSITSPNGKITNVLLNSNGYLSSLTNPKGEIYTMSYKDAGGLIASFKKPNGSLNTFSYDSDGLLNKDQHSGGMSTTLGGSVDMTARFLQRFHFLTADTGALRIRAVLNRFQRRRGFKAFIMNHIPGSELRLGCLFKFQKIVLGCRRSSLKVLHCSPIQMIRFQFRN